MTRKTHTTGAALAGALVALAAEVDPLGAGVIVVGALACAMIPDWDRALDTGPNHRSITHSLVFAGGFAVLTAVLAVATFGFAGAGEIGGAVPDLRGFLFETPPGGQAAPYLGTFAVGGAAGYVSHLLLDSLTGKRIWLLFPGGPRFGLGIFRTGTLGEAAFALLLVALLGYALYALVAV